MNRNELLRRYFVFFMAITIAGFGVALTAKAAIGISSLACTAYVISEYFPVTMGVMVIAFNVLTVLLQPLMMTKEERKAQFVNMLLQIPTLLMFGFFVDFFLWLMRDFKPEEIGYWMCMVSFIVGSLLIAINIVMQAVADVAKIACDAFVIVFAKRFNFGLGKVKLYFDLIFIIAAALISIVCSGFTEVIGIREGTILGAIIVGPGVQFFTPFFKPVERWISKASTNQAKTTSNADA